MAGQKKIALLDTDFVSKTHISRLDATHHLSDLLLSLPDYTFCCHEKTVDELNDHGIDSSPQWLQDQINAGNIQLYTDHDILNELRKSQHSPQMAYRTFLKQSCDTFESGYYETEFAALNLLSPDTDDITFLQTLKACETAIGPHQSLGEKKSLVLLQLLDHQHTSPIYVFCSDDRGARSGVSRFSRSTRCISVISSFHLLKGAGFSKAEMQPYYDTYDAFITRDGTQTTFRVWEPSSTPRMQRVPCRQVFDDVYAGKFTLLQNGDLKYIN